MIPYMVETFGKKVYVIAADYNFGQLSAEWNRTILKELGGTVVGEEFIPLGVSQFGTDDPEHPEGQARLDPDDQRRRRPGLVLRAGRRRQAEPADGLVDQGHARLRAQALRAARAEQDACRRRTGSRKSTRRRPRSSRSAGARSSRARPTSTTWATTPTTPSTSTSMLVERREVDEARRPAQGHRDGQGLHRGARRQDLHRPEEPAHLAPHAPHRRR